ncbi:MAG TPA: polyprenyl synthetase family protein [Actinomycetota bacterium]|nr:polyprenyl synthetase family protein [Actinomycetota bacterium]
MAPPRPGPAAPPAAIAAVVTRVDAALLAFLSEQEAELAGIHPGAPLLVDELRRLLAAGGKRLRPVLCYWGHRAAGGPDGEPILRAAAALELLHTFALIHDDVMDRSPTRRGVPASHVRFAGERPGPDAAHRGLALAVLAGDLAMVLADRLLDASGFPSPVLAEARRRYDRMRVEMAVGQLLDLTAEGATPADALRISSLKTGGYTFEGPLQVGAILAGGSLEVLTALARYGRPLGQAFQIRDDLEAGGGEPPASGVLLALAREAAAAPDRALLERAARDPGGVDGARVRAVLEAVGARRRAEALLEELVREAVAALEGAEIDPRAKDVLAAVARTVGER